jgi:hypothetical protein
MAVPRLGQECSKVGAETMKAMGQAMHSYTGTCECMKLGLVHVVALCWRNARQASSRQGLREHQLHM